MTKFLNFAAVGCRCEPCRAAATAAKRELRNRRRTEKEQSNG